MSLYSVGSEQLLDHSHLKPGDNASLLSYAKTINMYRANAKKTNDVEIQCDFAIFLVEAAKRLDESGDPPPPPQQQQQQDLGDDTTTTQSSASAYLNEAEKLLKQVAIRGHSASQYYLANMYSSGLLHKSNKFEYDRAFPFYVQAAKHHHPDAAYRTAKCYEDGLGTRRDKGKAVQFYRKAATLNHPGAMYRLGLAEIKGELGLSSNIRDGHKWLKRSAEASTTEYPHALHELGHLHERGLASIIFQDHDYAVRLYQDASDLGYAPSCFRLGECYEFGRLGCTVDPRLSMHYYGLAAEQGHPHACFALTAWYLIGVPGLMEPSDEQAFAWAKVAAHSPVKGGAHHQGLARAEYAVGYFYEVGIGIEKNMTMAWTYYRRAAEQGEKRAMQRLQSGDAPSAAEQTAQMMMMDQQQQPAVYQSSSASTPPALSPPHSNSSESSLSTNSSSAAAGATTTTTHPHRHSMQPPQQRPTPTSSSSASVASSRSWVKKWKQKLNWTKSRSSSSPSLV
ncbi:hypothetical protein BCR42DRAFT_336086 [Absidia repens]|uniref:HCP-like protein n=1 Tax=Absidia repens TaxID=90262 RepID=A0A1X2I2H3_9FUNG|nr:hypothetical protein BCR42DRAFT_336086 [Absidia repens]